MRSRLFPELRKKIRRLWGRQARRKWRIRRNLHLRIPRSIFMGSIAQKCRERALNCKYLADAARDPAIRFDLMEISRQWWELAGQIELLERLAGFARTEGPSGPTGNVRA